MRIRHHLFSMSNQTPSMGSPKEQEGVVVEEETHTARPSMYKVILLNDDFTPMDFVVDVLARFFDKNNEEAITITMQVHNDGAGLAGIFPFDIAETKAHLVNSYSRQNQHPLKCIIEKEEDHAE